MLLEAPLVRSTKEFFPLTDLAGSASRANEPVFPDCRSLTCPCKSLFASQVLAIRSRSAIVLPAHGAETFGGSSERISRVGC
jgi:hypothetical protein